MRKFALLPVAALLMLGACSSDDPEVRPVPNDPVQSVTSVADHVTLNAPAQADVKNEGSYFRVSYANGQEIVYAFLKDATKGYIATVKKIEGSSADVVIPASVKYNNNDFAVYSLDLFLDGVSDVVTSLTIPNTAAAMVVNAAYVAVDGAYLRTQMERCQNVKKLELEDGFPGFCSINGAIYSADFKVLECVPRGYEGTLTVAEDTEEIAPRALYYCSKIDVLTIPAKVAKIGDEAVVFNDNLLLINCLATTAPEAVTGSFGTFAHNGVLRIPAGAEASYKPEKPTLERPIMPNEPDGDASDEEWDAFYEAEAKYYEDLAVYDEANNAYTSHEGWVYFKNVESVNF